MGPLLSAHGGQRNLQQHSCYHSSIDTGLFMDCGARLMRCLMKLGLTPLKAPFTCV